MVTVAWNEHKYKREVDGHAIKTLKNMLRDKEELKVD
jgi:hypothetical protein